MVMVVTFVVADGQLTSTNQARSGRPLVILCVLLGNAVTE